MIPLAHRPSLFLLLRVLIATVAISIAIGLLGVAAPVQAAGRSIPVTVRNATDSSAPVYLYVIGEKVAGSTQGYVDAGGSFHAWPAATSSTPQSAPDAAIKGPANGSSKTIRLPQGVSGRLYYSIGRKLDFQLVRNGAGRTALVQPAPWVAGDPTRATLVDWTEFTSADGLWINSTQVDQFALPAKVSVSGSGRTRSVGGLVSGARNRVIKAMLSDPRLARTVVRDGDGRVLRVLAPGHAIRAGLMSPTYLDAAITRAWAAHAAKPLVVRPFAGRPALRYTGRTVGGRLVFTSATGARVASFAKPSTLDVFECAGTLLAPNDRVRGPIARTLCAALNRGTLHSSAVQPVTNASAFYRSSPVNAYAKAVHAAMADGRAYAFAFDDVGGHESLVHLNNPSRVTVTLPSLG